MLITRVDAGVIDRVLGINARCRRLNLSANAIDAVEPGTLSRLPELAELDLSDNRLAGAVDWAAQAHGLVALSLAGNAM